MTAGTRLGPYEIAARIGVGGMGEVYRARDTRLDRTVAIKVLPEALAADPQFRDRFEREARAISSLSHPHICTLYDVGHQDGTHYLVMEYLEGGTIAQRLEKGALPLDQAIRCAIEIADALDCAHHQGITHRDLKPGNIMLTKGGAKLLDFGLAKSGPPGLAGADLSAFATTPPNLTAQGTILGTFQYMAPEQAEGGPLDARADVFSFGAVLYEMISGSCAFRGTSIAQVLSAVLRDDPRPVQAPPAVAYIVTRCLAKQPGQRFQTMADVKAALEQAVQKSPSLEPSIAVLPFANLSADKENEYFSDGLAEEIINVLAHVPGLKVIARTSAFAFRGKEQDIRTIAHTLGVRSILEGSVRRSGSRIRVTAQLIDAEGGHHLWSERYDREMADVFGIQDDIALAIASALQTKLSVAPAVSRRYTPNLPAYDAYLKALHDMGHKTPDQLTPAKKWLEQAIALDPQFALAHSTLGFYFLRLALPGLMSAHDAMPLVRGAAREALRIDPSQPEAHALLGAVAAIYDYDWLESDRLFRLATRGDSVPPIVRFTSMLHLVPVGRSQEAIAEYERALQEDPLNLVGRFQLGFCLQAAGMPAQAAMQFRRVLGLDESFWLAAHGLSMTSALEGRLPEAIEFAEKAYVSAPWSTNTAGALAGLLKLRGDTHRAEEIFGKLGDGPSCGAPVGFVIFHLLCSEPDKAADWAEKAIEQRDPRIAGTLRLFGTIWRSSPRWPALARQMNLSPTAADFS
jgi:serine/threonine protein kinase/Tfp pilus assembly protein PilF